MRALLHQITRPWPLFIASIGVLAIVPWQIDTPWGLTLTVVGVGLLFAALAKAETKPK